LRNGANGVGQQGPRGYNGCIYRRSVWQTGKVYHNDVALSTNGEKYIDLCFNKDMTLITDNTLELYECLETHTSSSQIQLGNSSYWNRISISSTAPTYFPMIFATQISADLIDVSQIKVTDLADINNLVVQNVYSKNGTFSFDSSGNMVATSGTFSGNVRIPLTTISCGYYGSSTDYYLSNTTAGNFVLSYGYTSSTSEKYVRVILPSPSSSYNGTCYMFIMPPRSGSLTDTSQLAGMKLMTSSGTSFYNYSNLSAGITNGCSAMIFSAGMVRVLSDGSAWYVIECSASCRMYYSSAWHDSNQVLSTTLKGMELSGTTLTLS
jgi:hypothetical protein